VERIAAISRFAQPYGLGLELSLLSPLEIGRDTARRPGNRVSDALPKGLRDPQSGAFSVELWRQRRWANNKGPLLVKDAGVRVFAFHERPIRGTPTASSSHPISSRSAT